MRKVGTGVGVGGTKEGRGVGPLGVGAGVGVAGTSDAPAPTGGVTSRVPDGRHAVTETQSANAPTSPSRMRRRRIRAGRRTGGRRGAIVAVGRLCLDSGYDTLRRVTTRPRAAWPARAPRLPAVAPGRSRRSASAT